MTYDNDDDDESVVTDDDSAQEETPLDDQPRPRKTARDVTALTTYRGDRNSSRWLLEVTSSRLARHRTSSGGHVVEAEDLYEVHKAPLRYLRLLLYRLQSIRLDNDRRTKYTAQYANDM